jgi:hypothetical protein
MQVASSSYHGLGIDMCLGLWDNVCHLSSSLKAWFDIPPSHFKTFTNLSTLQIFSITIFGNFFSVETRICEKTFPFQIRMSPFSYFSYPKKKEKRTEPIQMAIMPPQNFTLSFPMSQPLWTALDLHYHIFTWNWSNEHKAHPWQWVVTSKFTLGQ